MREDSAENLFQSFLQVALVCSSGMGRDVHSLMLSIQHFLFRPQRRQPSTVSWRMVSEKLSWRVTYQNHASFRLLTKKQQPRNKEKLGQQTVKHKHNAILTAQSARVGTDASNQLVGSAVETLHQKVTLTVKVIAVCRGCQSWNKTCSTCSKRVSCSCY